jgi:hypothetical protein
VVLVLLLLVVSSHGRGSCLLRSRQRDELLRVVVAKTGPGHGPGRRRLVVVVQSSGVEASGPAGHPGRCSGCSGRRGSCCSCGRVRRAVVVLVRSGPRLVVVVASGIAHVTDI